MKNDIFATILRIKEINLLKNTFIWYCSKQFGLFWSTVTLFNCNRQVSVIPLMFSGGQNNNYNDNTTEFNSTKVYIVQNEHH